MEVSRDRSGAKPLDVADSFVGVRGPKNHRALKHCLTGGVSSRSARHVLKHINDESVSDLNASESESVRLGECVDSVPDALKDGGRMEPELDTRDCFTPRFTGTVRAFLYSRTRYDRTPKTMHGA